MTTGPEQNDALTLGIPEAVERYKWAGDCIRGDLVVDAGCGMGYGTHMLHEKGYTMVGMDTSRDALSYARNVYPGPLYIHGNIEGQSFPGCSLVILEAWSHLVDPYAWLKSLQCDELIISMPLIPSKDVYPWRKHDVTEQDLVSLLSPKFLILDELRQADYIVFHCEEPV